MRDDRIKFDGLGELLYWSYANCAMLNYAFSRGLSTYNQKCFMIRARLFKGLGTGSMSVKSMRYFQMEKMRAGYYCFYCAASGDDVDMCIDHVLPVSRGGDDSGDNLVLACRSCNSSKGDTCFLEWLYKRGRYPALFALVMFLKLVIDYCKKNDIMGKHREELDVLSLPFNPNFIPVNFPEPSFFYSE